MNFLSSFDVLLITNPTNIRYLTGFVGVAEHFADQAYLFTNSLYREQVRNLKLLNCYIVELLKTKNQLKTVEISREESFAKKLAEILKRSHLASQGETLQGVRLGFEEDDLKVSEYNAFSKVLKGITLIPTKNRIEKLRMIKREDEIDNIRKAARLTDKCFEYIVGKLKPRATEAEIAWEIEAFIRKNGSELAFSPIVTFNAHSSQPHYLSMNHEPLTMDSLVLLDLGARVNGYCADMTRVVFIGKPKNEWLRAYETVLTAQLEALNSLIRHSRAGGNPGNKDSGSRIKSGMTEPLSGAALDQLARTIIKEAGYPPYSHSLGHGVGLAIHEAPRLTHKKNVVLKSGMVITVEPGIYIEGQYGIRIEDLVLLKEEGIEILSKTDKNIKIL